MKQLYLYYVIRTLTHPFSYLPFSFLRKIGRAIGSLCFYFLTEYRKRTLSNLSLANDLALSHKELFSIAKKSFQNLAITCLEYPKLERTKNLSKAIVCDNPDIATVLHQQGQGIIFFCGHQSNWEVLFLDGTSRMKGTAIGKPIKNRYLYKWVISIREKYGGKIITPKNAMKEGLRALRRGDFLGIVGDQGMPDSGYAFPFLGRRAWSSTAPALLAYKAECPIIFASTKREPFGYRIHYSDPIWPDTQRPMAEEVVRIMDHLLTLLQESIRKTPDEWLWQHNRWKQQTPRLLFKRFRQDCVCLVLPEEKSLFQELLPHLHTFKKIYPLAFLSLMIPSAFQQIPLIEADEKIYYKNPQEMLRKDYRFKLVFNLSSKKLTKHYKSLSAMEVLDQETLQTLASPHLKDPTQANWSEIFIKALCRPLAWEETLDSQLR